VFQLINCLHYKWHANTLHNESVNVHHRFYAYIPLDHKTLISRRYFHVTMLGWVNIEWIAYVFIDIHCVWSFRKRKQISEKIYYAILFFTYVWIEYWQRKVCSIRSHTLNNFKHVQKMLLLRITQSIQTYVSVRGMYTTYS